MAITASDVNQLRQMTGAGMMDCKKALVEAEGDFDKAIEILRKKGQKVSEKRADRETAEGAVFVKATEDQTVLTLIALSCETDFVAKNDEFQALGQEIVEAAFSEKPASTDSLLTLSLGENTVQEKITNMVGKIGEKIEIKAYEQIEGELVVSYVHSNGKVGVVVELAGANNEAAADAGRDVAMQVAAMKPVALSKDDVPQEIVDRELQIGREQAAQEGKPENILDKIAQGKLQKFYKENTLLEQSFVKDNSMTVSKYLDSVEKGLTVNSFKRIEIGA